MRLALPRLLCLLTLYVVAGCSSTASNNNNNAHDEPCPPNQIVCLDGGSHLCLPDGSGTVFLADCAAQGLLCIPGQGCASSGPAPGSPGAGDPPGTNPSGEDGDTEPAPGTPGNPEDPDEPDDDAQPDAPGDGGDSGEEPDAGPPPICRHGERRCVDNVVNICSSGGHEWHEGLDCEASGQRCEDGFCVGCRPGTMLCLDQETPGRCEDDGDTITALEPCTEERGCVEGACVGKCGGDGQVNLSYMGCEYFAVDLPNHSQDRRQFAVVVSNPDSHQEATLRISYITGTGNNRQETEMLQEVISPRDLKVIYLNSDFPPRHVSGAVKNFLAYRLLSDHPVIAYQFSPLNNILTYSNDASLLLPTQTLDREYFTITGDALANTYPSFITVVGVAQHPTRVTITMPPGVQFSAPSTAQTAGQVISATLEPFEVLNIISRSTSANSPGDGNLSGARIEADGPVAAFGGNACTRMPQDQTQRCCCDHLESQLLPLSTWGRVLVAGASYQRRVGAGNPIPDYWRIVAAEDGTQLNYIPQKPTGAPDTLNRGQSVQFASASDFIVSADHPISLMQFLSSSYQAVGHDSTGSLQRCSGDNQQQAQWCTQQTGYLANCKPVNGLRCTPLGDPAMMPVPPSEQFRSDYIFLTPLNYQMDFITVVAPETAAVSLDGDPINDGWRAIGQVDGVTWVRAALRLTPGVHRLEATEPVGLMVYGLDQDVSYGYAAGLDLEKIFVR